MSPGIGKIKTKGIVKTKKSIRLNGDLRSMEAHHISLTQNISPNHLITE